MTARLCSECVRCEDCSDIAYCLEDAMPPPCPHDRALCGECALVSCPDCRLDAEREMHESGEYDPRKDPFYIGTPGPSSLADVAAEQEAHLAARKAASGFDPATNTHSTPYSKEKR